MKQNASFLKKIKNKNKTSGKRSNILEEWEEIIEHLYYTTFT